MGNECSRPDLDLPDFRVSPDPRPFKIKSSEVASTVPVDMRVKAPAIPAEIAVSQISVMKKLAEELVPGVFGAPDVSQDSREKNFDEIGVRLGEHYRKHPDEWELVSSEQKRNEKETTICIKDTKMHRLLMHHALLGFSFEAAPFCMRTLSEAAPPSATAPLDKGADSIELSAMQFKHDLLVLNMHILSSLLKCPSGWAFTIALEPSPYYGYGGLEARLCLYGPRRKQLSFHLIGIADPTEDITSLLYVLMELCPTARLRYLGIVTNLSEEEHSTQLGCMVSAVITYFGRLAPRTRPFFTPDHALRGSRPPLFPLELARASAEDVKLVVNEFRQILEISWDADDIAQIMRDHELLKQEPMGTFQSVSDKTNGEGRGLVKHVLPDDFDEAWEAFGERFGRLHDFAGGLATAYLYAPKPRTRAGITNVMPPESGGHEVTTRATDAVLHAQQFAELRNLLQ